jgi:hypothetical protein
MKVERYQILLGEQPDIDNPKPVSMVLASDYDKLASKYAERPHYVHRDGVWQWVNEIRDGERDASIDGQPLELVVDEKRKDKDPFRNSTGIYVRARTWNKVGSYDIAELDSDSLKLWTSRLTHEGLQSIIIHLLGHK